MPVIEPPDSHFLSAALGWLELGDHREARAEYEKISPHLRSLEQVGLIDFAIREAQWFEYAKQKNWAAALDLANLILDRQPDRPAGWLHRAYALRRIVGGGLTQAFAALLPAAHKFPDEEVVPYNLACYACQLGRNDEAREWLAKALVVGKPKEIKARALRDSDLQPLWPEIRLT